MEPYRNLATTHFRDSRHGDPRFNPIAFLPTADGVEGRVPYGGAADFLSSHGRHALTPPDDLPVFAAVRSAMTRLPEGDRDTLAALAPVELVVTADAPTAEPPWSWEPDVHLDELRSDPDVVLTED